MSKNDFITPVVLIIFNRPDITKKLFDVISNIKPTTLFIIADGPRNSKVGEISKCQAARDIFNSIDWNCTVEKNYSDINLGCKHRISSGLDWVFF